ncbi:cation diffusion facilitator family transporter [Phycisphaeraceae bacterium D3-23]
MTHDHSHHSTEGVSDTRLLWSFVINQLLTVAQVVAGFLSGSVALLSDAAHNFNDANALLIAYIARRVSRKDADHRYTFGYRRAELIGALINLTTLGVIGLALVYQAVMRFFEPVEIIGWLMAAAAGLAIVVDLGTALLLWSMSRGSLNVRAAFVHNLVDALGSVAVLLAAGLIIWLDWNWVDPVLTLVIAGYVLWQVFKMMPQAVRILMEGTPPDLDLDQLAEQVERIPGVETIHHLHVWQLDEEHRALEAHVVTPDGADAQWTQTKQQIKDLLQEEFDIHHSTLEHEPQTPIDKDCENAGLITPH